MGCWVVGEKLRELDLEVESFWDWDELEEFVDGGFLREFRSARL